VVVDVEELLEALGVENVRRVGEEVEYSCPFPAHERGDSRPSASMSTEEPYPFHCFGCGAGGTAVSFVSSVEGIPPWTAQRWIKERWGDAFREPEGTMREELEDMFRRVRPTGPRRQVKIDWPEEIARVNWQRVGMKRDYDEVPESLSYMLDRGFRPDDLEEWEIGFDTVSDRIAIPVRDEDGDLIGFKGRAWWDARAKYVVLGGDRYSFPTYDIGQVLFGLHNCRSGDVVLVEGELDAIALQLVGFEACAAAHARLTPRQASLLRDKAKRLTVFFDDDDAGRRGAQGVVRMLDAYMSIRVVGSHEGDPCSMTPEQRIATVNGAVHHLLHELV